jgi:uncharacterized membrane protein YoaK (UPF0700 family)
MAGSEPGWIDRRAFLVGLTAVAGWVDALSFLFLGHVFTSFMSGNWLFLGLGAGGGDGGLVVRAAAAMAAFVVGGAAGARLVGPRLVPASAGRAIGRALLLEGVLLASFAAVWLAVDDPAGHAVVRVVLLALAGCAMGVQASLSLALHVPYVATVALTAGFAELARLAGMRSTDRPGEQPGAPLLLALCLSYFVSALVVALLPAGPALAAVPLLLLALVATTARGAHRRGAAA